MKHVLICSALTAALASGFAQADNHGTKGNAITGQSLVENGYVEARLGFADVGLDDSAVIVAGTFGTSLSQVYPGLGAEADLTLTAVDAESNYFGGTVEASYASLAGYATYTHSLGKEIRGLEVLGRLGLAYTDADVSASNGMASASASDSSIDFAIGIGARYNLRANLALVGRLDTYDDIDVFSFGATYRF